MQLLKYTYFIKNFIICLQSNKVYNQTNKQININYKRNNLKFYQILILIYNIISIKKKSKQQKCRLNNLLTYYKLKKEKSQKELISKYLQIFIYKYSNSYKCTVKNNEKFYRSQLNTIHIIALTYIYTIYKLIRSNKRIYLYGLLIMKKYK